MIKENKKIAMLIFFAAILAFIAAPVLAGGKNRGRLNDRVEIEQLLKDYAWGVDHKDAALWMSIWSKDAVYDLSNLNFGMVEGLEALENFMNCIVFPGEPMCFSLISNIDIKFIGKNKAVGTDYFIHEGYVPVDKDDATIKFSQFNPNSWYLVEELIDNGTDPLLADEFAFVRDHKEGQHVYKFVKEKGRWKISYLKGLPLFSAASEPVESVVVRPDPCNPDTWFDNIPIDQRPNAEFFNNWLDTVFDSCWLPGPCPDPAP